MSTQEEVWQPIPDRVDAFASSGGLIRRRVGVKQGWVTTRGWDDGQYYRVMVNGVIEKVHRLVALAFHPNPHNKPQVNHKNGNKRDNQPLNLEWATHAENLKHAGETGLMAHLPGEENGFAKLTEDKVREIFELRKNRSMTQRAVAKLYGISQAHVWRIAHRHVWAHLGRDAGAEGIGVLILD